MRKSPARLRRSRTGRGRPRSCSVCAAAAMIAGTINRTASSTLEWPFSLSNMEHVLTRQMISRHADYDLINRPRKPHIISLLFIKATDDTTEPGVYLILSVIVHAAPPHWLT